MFRIGRVIGGCVVSILAVAVAHANGLSIDRAIVVAAAGNAATVKDNFAYSARWNVEAGQRQIATASTESSYDGTRGVSEEAQITGANSVVENSISISSAEFCAHCALGTVGGDTIGVGSSLNHARVEDNLDYPGFGPSGSGTPGGDSNRHGGDPGGQSGAGRTPGSHGLDPQGSDPIALIRSSFNRDTGVFASAQNVGDNSLIQNAVALGVVSARKQAAHRIEYGEAVNRGINEANTAFSFDTQTATYIRHSFDGSLGIDDIGQNAAPNSLVQNSTAIAMLETPLAGDRLSQVVAGSFNFAKISGNYASTESQYNAAGMSASFSNSTGIFQVEQNSGSNSSLQNVASLSVGSAMP